MNANRSRLIEESRHKRRRPGDADMATATKTKRGFRVDCIHCGERGTVSVDLGDLENFSCSSCEGNWTAEDVRKNMAEWAVVLEWVSASPIAE